VAPSRMVGVSASVNLPLHHKVQKFSSGQAHPGGLEKRAVKCLWCGVADRQTQTERQRDRETETDVGDVGLDKFNVIEDNESIRRRRVTPANEHLITGV